MDLTPESLRQVSFRAETRGYHRDDVDSFLEDVAARLVEQQNQLEALSRRLARAEEDSTESRDLQDTMHRTLILAQRTADAAVKEAHADAEKVQSEADEKARALFIESEDRASKLNQLADEKAQAIVENAEQRAEDVYRDTRMRLAAEVEELESTRKQAERDLAQLRADLAKYREELRAGVDEVAAIVGAPGFLEIGSDESTTVRLPG